MLVPIKEFLARLAALEAWLWSDASRPLGLGRLPRPDTLAGQVVVLSDLYNSVVRESLPQEAGDRSHLIARVLYFLISDAPKIYLVMAELEARYPRPASDGRPLRVLDLGAGVGAATVGLLLGLDAKVTPSVEIRAIDSDAVALNVWLHVARQAAAIAGVRLTARPQAADLADPAPGMLGDIPPWDLCIAQSVLNELVARTRDDPVEVRAKWIGQWASRGLTIVIEPALRATTRPLHAARDRLLATGGFRVLAPCPHQQACPILANERDWCHEVRLLAPPPLVAKVQEMTRRRDERTKFSFVVMGPDSSSSPGGEAGRGASMNELVVSGPPPNLPPGGGEKKISDQPLAGRIVSDSLSSKGKVERWLCCSNGQLTRLRLLDKDRTGANELLATADRGTLVRIEGAAGLPRLSKETVVCEGSAGGASLRDSR